MNQLAKIRMYYAAKYRPVFLSALKSQDKEFIRIASENPEKAISLVNDIYTREPIKNAFVGLYGSLGRACASYTRNKYQKSAGGVRTKKTNDTIDNEFETVMRAYAVSEAGQRITGITGTSREIAIRKLRELMTRAQSEGIAGNQLSQFLRDELEKEFSRFEQWRADRIVQTESVTAQNKGSFEGAKSLGIDLKKKWVATPGLAVEERHAVMFGVNGQEQEMNMPFNIGGESMMYPGDPNASADNVINCRCDMIYIPK